MVFVTGATGLLGSHLLYFLAASGQQIVALKRKDSRMDECRAVFSQYTDDEGLWCRITWVVGDVLEVESIEKQIREAGCVYHCAAMVSFHGSDRQNLLDTNLKGTENVAGLCLKYAVRLCYVSSIAALGDSCAPDEWIDEETPEVPESEHSLYSHSKSDAEKIVWRYVTAGLDAVVINPSIILGGGLWGRSSTRLFLTASKGMMVYTKGVVGYVDVRDVCELMIRLAENFDIKGERFILNGGNYSYKQLFTEITRATGHRPPLIYMAPWLTATVWRFLAIMGWLFGIKPAFTRETARSAHHRSYYSNAKIKAQFPDFRFHSLEETINRIQAVSLK